MSTAFRLKAPVPTEADECEWLMRWAAVKRHEGKRLSDLLVMIPNGAVLAGDYKHRAIQMARMKRAGFRVGVADYFLPIAIRPYHGLWLELKRTERGVLSDEQERFAEAMGGQGYAAAVCKGWQAAAEAITGYLRL